MNREGYATLDEAMTVGTDLVLNTWPDTEMAHIGYVVDDPNRPGRDCAVVLATMRRLPAVPGSTTRLRGPSDTVQITLDLRALAALEALKGGK